MRTYIDTLGLGLLGKLGLLGVLLLPFYATGTHAADNKHVIEPIEYAAESARAPKALLLDVAQAGSRLVAVGAHGHIIYSDNNGTDWQQAASVPTRATLTDVLFLDNKIGYAVGHDSVILKTEDSGENWHLQYKDITGEYPLFGIHFANARHGFAVGAFSFMLETNDGGLSWKPYIIDQTGDEFHLNAIFADRRGNIFIPSEAGQVYRSMDDGKTFSLLDVPYDGSFWGGMTLDAGRKGGKVLIWGMRGNAFTTQDEGRTWRKSSTNTDRSIGGGVQLGNGHIVLTGLSGLVLVSNDKGENFSASVRPDRRSFETVAAGKNNAAVWLFGDAGVVSHQLR